MTPEQLAELHAACFTTPRPWSAQEFQDMLATDGVFLLVRPGGFLIGRIAGPEAEALTLAVDPAYRRTGIARNLMQSFEDTAKAQGATDAFLEVSSDNSAAIALYHNLGFRDVGHRKDYYAAPTGTKISAHVMKRSLISR